MSAIAPRSLQLVSPPAHVLLTRFNLPDNGYEGLVRAKDGWLHDRVALFERYCLPSVMAQTNQDFSWIIYFDPQSPQWLLDRIERWRAACSQLHPIFREQVSYTEKQLDIAEVVGRPRRRLLTTNLDNDDGLGRDFVERLQAASPLAGRSAVYLGLGLILHGERCYLRREPDNAFCGVSEDWHDPITCWAYPHPALHHHMDWVVVAGPPGWLQVVHGRNVSNRVRGRRVSPAPYHENFPFGLGQAKEPSIGQLLADNFARRPLRLIRESWRLLIKTAVERTAGRDGVDRVKRLYSSLRRNTTGLFGGR